jgi:hypothetical protein
MDTTQPVPEKSTELIDGREAALSAIDAVIAATVFELCIFDVHVRALSERGFGTPGRYESLRALLMASRSHRLRLVLHDTQGFESKLPRIQQLLTQFSGQMSVNRTSGAAREATDPLVIGDDRHFWHKLHVDHPRSVLTLNDAAGCRPLRERFEEIWELSEPAISGTTLGL